MEDEQIDEDREFTILETSRRVKSWRKTWDILQLSQTLHERDNTILLNWHSTTITPPAMHHHCIHQQTNGQSTWTAWWRGNGRGQPSTDHYPSINGGELTRGEWISNGGEWTWSGNEWTWNGGEWTWNGSIWTSNEGEWTSNRGEWTSNRGERTSYGGEWTLNGGERTSKGGEWTTDRGEWILDGDEWTMEVNRWQMESNGGQANKRWRCWTTLDNRRRKGRRTDQGRRQIPTWRAQMCGESTMKNSRLSSSLSKPMVTTTIHYYYDNAIRRHWSRINTSNYYKQMGKTGRVLLYKLTAAQYNLAKYTTCHGDKLSNDNFNDRGRFIDERVPS